VQKVEQDVKQQLSEPLPPDTVVSVLKQREVDAVIDFVKAISSNQPGIAILY